MDKNEQKKPKQPHSSSPRLSGQMVVRQVRSRVYNYGSLYTFFRTHYAI